MEQSGGDDEKDLARALDAAAAVLLVPGKGLNHSPAGSEQHDHDEGEEDGAEVVKAKEEEWFMSVEHVMAWDSETDYSSDGEDGDRMGADGERDEQRAMMRTIVEGFPKRLLEKDEADGEELLYDSEEDEENEKWLAKTMRKFSVEDGPKGMSDATLSCPACFALLCLESQQHEKYDHQYRAVFVRNCKKDETKALELDGQEYHPVFCSQCGTQVGVCDSQDVYEFFHVLPSIPPKLDAS